MVGPEEQALPADADALRGGHFRSLLASSSNRAGTAAAALAAGLAVGIFAGSALIGAGAALATVAIGLIVIFSLADDRSADAFFAAYAEARGMTLLAEQSRFPETTPLLRKGDERYAERQLEGPLAEGPEGKLATYTYEEISYGKNGKEVDYHRFTVGYLEVVESVPLVPELFVHCGGGLRFGDFSGGKWQRVELESSELDRRYEIIVSEMQDLNAVRQLFSPTFIVWLAEEAPDGFGFELAGGKLCCYVTGHREDAESLDWVAQATVAVAERLRAEALE
jgi:hypothetical protein